MPTTVIQYIAEGSTLGKENIIGAANGPNTDMGASDAVLAVHRMELLVLFDFYSNLMQSIY